MKRAALLLAFLLAAASGRAEPVEIAGLTLQTPAGWADVLPTSPMRAFTWTVPGAKGEAAGEVVAFFFGVDQGGDAATNLTRWAATMTTPQGTPAPAAKTTRAAGPVAVNQVETYGTYAAPPAAPGLPAMPQADTGLVGVILDFPGGPVYLRLTGPAALVRRHLAEFTRFVDSAKVRKTVAD